MVGLTVYSESVKARAKELLEAGENYPAVARRLGVWRSTVSRWHPGYEGESKIGNKRSDHEDIIQAFHDGLSDKDIAKRFGMKQKTVQKFRTRNGLYRGEPGSPPKVTEEGKADMLALLDEGYSYRAVGEMTGHTEQTVAKHFPGRGYTPEQTAEAAVLARKANKIYRKLAQDAA